MNPTSPAPTVREPTVTLEDVTGSLLWPRLLRTPALALRPERLLAGMACVVIVGLLGRISGLWNDAADFNDLLGVHVLAPLGGLVGAVTPWEGQVPLGVAAADLIAAPADLLRADPVAFFVLGIPMLLVWAVAGVMIARSAAVEVSLGRILSWPETLGFALSKWLGAVMSVVAPVLLVALVWLLMAAGGAVLFSWPVGDVLGAVLFGLTLAGAIFAVLVALGFLLGWALLLPAIACEGTDALDAVQRVYAYVVGRPLRLIVYLLIALLAALLAFAVAGWVAGTGNALASQAAAEWSGERGETVLLTEVLPPPPPKDAPEGLDAGPGATARAAHRIVGFWRSVLLVVLAGYAVSLLHTGGTLVYLLCRRINDGQEIAELWTPDAR